MSLDGFTAGLNQSFEKPFGDNFNSDLLDRWMFAEPEKHKHKKEIDAILDAGAFIMGSNMLALKTGETNRNGKGGGVTIPRITLRFSCFPIRSENR